MGFWALFEIKKPCKKSLARVQYL